MPLLRASLVVDTNLGRVVSHREPQSARRPELSAAHRIIADEARAARSDLPASMENEAPAKTRCRAVSRKR